MREFVFACFQAWPLLCCFLKYLELVCAASFRSMPGACPDLVGLLNPSFFFNFQLLTVNLFTQP